MSMISSRMGQQGDFLGIGKLLGGVSKILPGPLGTAAGLIGGVIKGSSPAISKAPIPVLKASPGATFALPGGAPVRVDSVKVTGKGLISPIGTVGSVTGTAYLSPSGRPRKKIRRMNALNPKALTRSIRRVDKFQTFARSVGFSRPPARLKGIHAPKRRRRATCR